MSFNDNATKRLCTIAGIDRESHEITGIADDLAKDYLEQILKRLIAIVTFCGRKTLQIDDIRFLPTICPEYPKIASANNFSQLVRPGIDIDDFKEGYAFCTLKKPFEKLVREIIRDTSEEIRIGDGVTPLLQSMTEHFIIRVLNQAGTFANNSKRETLLARDIKSVLKVCYA